MFYPEGVHVIRLFGRGGPPLRVRLKAARIGIAEAPGLQDDDEPVGAAPVLPRSPLDPHIVIGDGSWPPPERPADAHPLAGRYEPPASDYALEPLRPYTSDADQLAALIARAAKAEEERDAIAAELRRTQRLLTEEIEHSMAQAQAIAPEPKGKQREIVDSLREANQRLRGQLRGQVDRADRAEARQRDALVRIASLELTCQALARHHTGEQRPDVVVVDGAELVVPWGSSRS